MGAGKAWYFAEYVDANRPIPHGPYPEVVPHPEVVPPYKNLIGKIKRKLAEVNQALSILTLQNPDKAGLSEAASKTLVQLRWDCDEAELAIEELERFDIPEVSELRKCLEEIRTEMLSLLSIEEMPRPC